MIILVVIGSCQEQSLLPADFDEDKIVALMRDVTIAQAIIAKYPTDYKDSMKQVVRDDMAIIHQISPEKMDFIIEELQKNPRQLLIYQDSVTMLLDNMKSEASKVKVENSLDTLKQFKR